LIGRPGQSGKASGEVKSKSNAELQLSLGGCVLITMTKFRAIHWLQTSIWFWPLVCIGAGLALSLISVAVDRAFDGALIPRALTGGPDAALESSARSPAPW
jgi:hypothetical protein